MKVGDIQISQEMKNEIKAYIVNHPNHMFGIVIQCLEPQYWPLTIIINDQGTLCELRDVEDEHYPQQCTYGQGEYNRLERIMPYWPSIHPIFPVITFDQEMKKSTKLICLKHNVSPDCEAFIDNVIFMWMYCYIHNAPLVPIKFSLF